MNKTERIQAYCLSRSPDIECCGNCVHYHQHYVIYDGEYTKTAIGHCSHPRLKTRAEWDVCDNFQKEDKSCWTVKKIESKKP